jgi:hypothetical protein
MKSLPVTVHDISGEEDKYPIDTYGFQFVKHESKEKGFHDAEKIKAEYYPETAQLVKDVTGASRTYVFNHVIRRQPKEAADGTVPGRGPTYNAHVDQTYDDAPNRVRRYFPDEADELLKKRYQIINVSINVHHHLLKLIKIDVIAYCYFYRCGALSRPS